MFSHQRSTEDAWTCKPWNKIASTSTRLSANTLPALTPRPSDSNSSLRLSMASSHHRRPPSHPRLVGDVSSRSTMSHSDASCQASMSMYLWCDTAHVTCHHVTRWLVADVLCWSEEETTGVQSIALRAVFKNKQASFWAPEWNQTLPLLPEPLFFACFYNMSWFLMSKVLQIHLERVYLCKKQEVYVRS